VSVFGNETDIRVMNVRIDDDSLIVSLMDGRTISAPLAWFPRLANGSAEQRLNWQISGAGYGIYWPELDEDLSTEGLLRGAKGNTVGTTVGSTGGTTGPTSACP